MNTPRIFVSYHCSDEAFAERLVNDLRAAGADVTTDEASNLNLDDDPHMLYSELAACQLLILVQAPEALRSPRIHTAVDTALNLLVQGRMKGVLRMIATSSDSEELPPTWTTLQSFDGSRDYPRAYARMLLTLPLPGTNGTYKRLDAPPPAVLPVDAPLPSPRKKDTSLFTPSPISDKRSKEKRIPQNRDDRPLPVPPRALSLRKWPRLWYVAFGLIAIVIITAVIWAFLLIAFEQGSSSNASSANRPISSVVTNTNATATAEAAFQQLYAQATSGLPALSDTLSSQDGNNWKVGTTPTWSCTFVGSAYHISVLQSNLSHRCVAQNTNFINFAYQVEMTLIKGDAGDLLFRANDQLGQYYRFRLYSNGVYQVYKGQNGVARLLKHGRVTAVNPGQPDLLAALARGHNMYLYINQRYVTHVSDTSYSFGEIGLGCFDKTQPTEVMFRNAMVWTI